MSDYPQFERDRISPPLVADLSMSYERAKEKVLATFVLPPLYEPRANIGGGMPFVKSDLGKLPFPMIEIVQLQYEWTDKNGVSTWKPELAVNRTMMKTGVIVGESNDMWYLYEKITLGSGEVLRTDDFEKSRKRLGQPPMMPSSLPELLERLADARHHRYVDQPLSRQVRRAEGVSPTYRSYIVVETPTRKDIPPGSFTVGQVYRRHPKLHAVRAHPVQEYLRERNGKIEVVRAAFRSAHVRGKGDVLQPKDYIVK